MRHLQNSRNKSLVVVALSALVIMVVMALDGAGGNATNLTAQAFQSPIETPTPVPSPTPIPPSPPPPSGPSAEAQLALNYLASTYGLAPENLRVANEHRRDYPLLGRAFRAVAIYDTAGSGFYHLLVDLADRHIETDVAAIEQAATLALRARYGRLHPTLYERLQQIGDDEVLPVAIWSEARPVRSQAQLYAELARRFPAAAAALTRSGVPFDVGDPALADQILGAYAQMLSEDTRVQMRPLVQYLQGRGVQIQTFDGLPTVAARLSKRLILALNQRADVAMVFLIEEPARPAMDVAVPTSLVDAVWARGYTGAGIPLTILEMGNIVPINCLAGRITATRPAPPDPDQPEHKTRVASVAACDHATYRGVAPGANILMQGSTRLPVRASRMRFKRCVGPGNKVPMWPI